jgi:hypothetical protein
MTNKTTTMHPWWKKALPLLLGLQTASILGGCGQGGPGVPSLVNPFARSGVSTTTTTTIPASLSLEVKDPFFKRFTEAAESFDVVASGEFKPGIVAVHGVPLKIEKATKFKLSLNLPISDPNHINTANATGQLWTSAPMSLAGAPLPTTIKLSNGTASGECDVMHTIGVFIFNLLQNQIVDSSGGGGVHDVLQSMLVEKAVIALRPKAAVDFGKLHLNIGAQSTVQFNNLAIDPNSNYEGECLADLNLLPGCGFDGEKIDFFFEGGRAQFPVHCLRANSVLNLDLKALKGLKPITLNACVFKFGKNKQYFVKADKVDFNFKKFDWVKKENSQQPEIHMETAMLMNHTNLTMKDKKLDIVADFLHTVPADLIINRDEKIHEHLFSTSGTNIADTFNIAIRRGGSNILIDLANASIGPVNLNKTGELDISLTEGVAALKQIEWSNNKRSFKLITSGASTLAITKGSSMELTRDQGTTSFTLPITIKAGTATLAGRTHKLQLDQLNGSAVVAVDKDVQIDGNLDLSVAHSRLLADHGADIKVRGINLSSKDGQAQLLMKQCAIIIPNKALLAEFNTQLPKKKVFEIHKTVVQDRKWRYRDAVVETATVSAPKIEELTELPANGCSFKACGDVLVDGTIEKSGLLAIIKKTNKWDTKPWSATAHVFGEGSVKYKFVPNASLSDSALNYDLQMDLLMPDDMNLDWSQVNDGFLSKTESSTIVKSVSKLKPVPINYTGNFKLFSKGNAHLQALKIKDFKTKANKDNIEIDFAASSDF